MTVYCDTCIMIYALDHSGVVQQRAAGRLVQISQAGGLLAITDLVRLEYRVKPVRAGDFTKLAVFDAYVKRPDVLPVAITTPVFDRATLLRARHNFKLADSIHLAAAIEAGCDSFLTNDARLAACTDIAIEVLS